MCDVIAWIILRSTPPTNTETIGVRLENKRLQDYVVNLVFPLFPGLESRCVSLSQSSHATTQNQQSEVSTRWRRARDKITMYVQDLNGVDLS